LARPGKRGGGLSKKAFIEVRFLESKGVWGSNECLHFKEAQYSLSRKRKPKKKKKKKTTPTKQTTKQKKKKEKKHHPVILEKPRLFHSGVKRVDATTCLPLWGRHVDEKQDWTRWDETFPGLREAGKKGKSLSLTNADKNERERQNHGL